jgi:hypothetical protein
MAGPERQDVTPMPRTRVIVTGIAVAAAAVTGSAFTNANDFTGVDNNVAGYGELAVSGATITNIAYTPDTDATKLASVAFTSSTDSTGGAATMLLTSGGAAVTGGESTCLIGAFAAGSQQITCTVTVPVAFTAFDKVGLTVVSQ